MQKPLVSIIIPTYNRAHLLPRAIIVNDGSTDNTPEIGAHFYDKYKSLLSLQR